MIKIYQCWAWVDEGLEKYVKLKENIIFTVNEQFIYLAKKRNIV